MILIGENQVQEIQLYTNTSGGYAANALDTTSTGYVSSGASVTLLACNQGERLMIDAGYIAAADSSSTGDYIVRVADGAVNVDLGETERQSDLVGGERLVGLATTYVLANVTAGGTVIVTLMAKRIVGSGHIYMRTPVTLMVQRIRK